MAVCFQLTRLLTLSFCLSARPSVCRSFLWITDNGGMTFWWVSPWVGIVHDWSDTRKMKRKMRVYISSSAGSGLSGRKDPNGHIHFNNSNVWNSPRILLKKICIDFIFSLAIASTMGKLLTKCTTSSSVFQLRSCTFHADIIHITALWCNLINVHQSAQRATSLNLSFSVCVLGRGSRQLSNLYGDKGTHSSAFIYLIHIHQVPCVNSIRLSSWLSARFGEVFLDCWDRNESQIFAMRTLSNTHTYIYSELEGQANFIWPVQPCTEFPQGFSHFLKEEKWGFFLPLALPAARTQPLQCTYA